jgi:hypothetical protein
LLIFSKLDDEVRIRFLEATEIYLPREQHASLSAPTIAISGSYEMSRYRIRVSNLELQVNNAAA